MDNHPSHTEIELEHATAVGNSTLDPGNPRPLYSDTTVFTKLWRRILGLNPFRTSYARLYGTLHTPKDRAVAICGAVFAISAGIPLPLIGVIFAKIISSFPPDEAELRTRLLQLIGVAIAYFAVTTIYTISFGVTGDAIAIKLRQKLFTGLLHLEQAYLDTRDLEFSALLGEKIDTIQVGCSEKVGIFLQSMSYFVSAFTVGFILNAKLTGILFAAVIPAMAAVVSSSSMAISRFSRRISQSNQQANAIVESAIRAIKVVQAFDIMDEMCTKHGVHLDQSSRHGFRKGVVSALELGGAYFTAYAANALAFYIGSHMAASGEAGGDAGTIYAVVFLILDASFVLGQFAPFLEIFARAATAYAEIQEILDASRDASDSATALTAVETRTFSKEEIRFTSLSFAYPARQTVNAIDELDLTIRPGSFTAIVGTSGGGKSTLVSMLCRMYGYTGQISIGSQELRDIEIPVLKSQVSVLDQDCVLFSDTIFENIAHGLFGTGVAGSQRLSLCQQAAIDAGVDFLEILPKGIHTRIDNGLQLSGGQRQRICLARALVKRPSILILDEPTSALDAQSEKIVMQAVHKAVSQDTTVIMITHRLSTVLEADRVAVIADGRVVEEGTPSELSGRTSVFKGLLDAQKSSLLSESSELSRSTQFESPDGKDSIAKERNTPVEDESDTTTTKLRAPDIVTSFYRLIQGDRLIICSGVFASVISGSVVLGEAIVFGNLVQLLNSDSQGPDFQQEADLLCLIFFVLACIALTSYICSGTAFGIASARLTTNVQKSLLRHVLHLDIEWFSGAGRSPSQLTSSFSKDASDLSCLSGVALGTIFTVISSVLGGIILAHAVAWKIAVVLLAAVPIMLASGYVRLRMLAQLEIRQRTAYSEGTALALEACRYRRTVTILGLEQKFIRDYCKSLRRSSRDGIQFRVLCNTLLALSLAITYFVYALAYWWGSKQVRNSSYSQKQFFIVLPALLFSAQAAGQLFSLSPEIARAKTAAISIFRTLAYRSSIITLHDNRNVRGPSTVAEKSQDPTTPDIEFNDVALSYPGDHTRHALHNLSFKVPRCSTVALVGPSGAGKSSTINLLERFYDTSAGQILLNGDDLKQGDVQQARSRMALVPQEPELFPGSIEYNIKLGVGHDINSVTSEQIEEVTRQCGLHDFISSLPEGFQTECGPAGNQQLSGGQRQRLALARALIRRPDILLLDEPTSALDSYSEQHIQETLEQAGNHRTTIIVTHRLASIQHVDKIIVFDHGTAVEQGTHSELVQLGGLYASMAKTQALI